MVDDTRRGAEPARRRTRTDRAAAALDRRWLRALLRALPTWRGVLVLNYHRIGDSANEPWDRRVWSTSVEGLDDQLAFLARETDVVGPGDLPGIVAAARGRHVLLTFDDGYRDNFEHAYPLLRRHGLTGTFFLVSGFIDRPRVAWWDEAAWIIRHATRDVLPASVGLPADLPLRGPGAAGTIDAVIAHYKALEGDRAERLLSDVADAAGARRCTPADAAGTWITWDMAREMRDGGMSLGGHTVSHPVLSRIPIDAQRQEVETCATRLREEIGEPMRWFSYPVGFRGSYTGGTRALLAETGVEAAFSFYGGYGRFARWDPLDIPRVHVGPTLDRRGLQAIVRAPRLFARPD